MLRSGVHIAAARRLAVSPRPSFALASGSRAYVASTKSRSTPVAAVAEHAYDPSASVMFNKPKEDEPHNFNPDVMYTRSHDTLRLPQPLPIDVAADPLSLQADLYKSTSAIDTIAMLSICSSRPEFAPRAYNIFTTLLQDVKDGVAANPDVDAWANVIYGVSQLAKPAELPSEARSVEVWRSRIQGLIEEWEGMHTAGAPGLQNDGIRIYRAWLRGLSKVEADLSQLIPYIENPEIGLEALVREMSRDDLDAVLNQLDEYATTNALGWLKDQVSDVRGVEHEKRAIQEREVIAEVTPVLESAKEAKRRAEEAPEVHDRSTAVDGQPQARFIIKNLRAALDNINAPMTSYNRQMQLERASYQAAERELQAAAKALENAGSKHIVEAQRLQRDLLQAHMFRWQQDLADSLEHDIIQLRKKVASQKEDPSELRAPRYNSTQRMKDSMLLLYLDVLPAKRLALITVLELMRMVGSGGVPDGMKMLRGVLSVGRAVEAEHRADTIRNVAGSDSAVWARTLDPTTHRPSRSNVSSVWNQIGREREGEALMQQPDVNSAMNDLRAVWTPPWSQMVQVNVGSYLVEALMKVAKVSRHGTDPVTGEQVTEEQPAFAHTYEYVRGKKLGVLRLNPVVAQRLANDTLRQVIHPKHLPMLVPPRPWNQWNDGAYLATPVQVMRFKDSIEQINYIKEASKAHHLEPVFHGLDVLSSTPWAINRSVFDVILQAWNDGEGIADIPASVDKATYDMPEKPGVEDNDPVKRKNYLEKLKAINAQQRKDHAERCKYNYNLEIARSYLNDVFYIPHNMDFRGRAYPIPPHLSPVGDDLCRGLLTFGRSKPLGKTGLKWLQIHMANVYGYDKASFEERASFAREHEAEIFDSADHPLDGRRWWLQAEDPWQCLAACFELSRALRSPNPEEFESSLPIHQDGTCNGMQHYAALGGDVRGAKAVNLERGDRPADIYTGVADLVNKSIEEDAKAGIPVALMLKEPLGRKVVKQTVMTTVYGVTFVGARDQIAKQLKDRGDIQPDDIYMVSSYIARKVLASIGDLFSGAKAIMDWLAVSARLISRSIPPDRIESAATGIKDRKAAMAEQSKKKKAGVTDDKPVKDNRLQRELMTSVIWTTPLGLPVVQPYRKEAKKQVMTSLQTVYIHDPNAPSEVSPVKQATAFPPNFIHSLDATHMLLTAVKCNQSGISFASVHDSYWTHASTVESMSEVIRDTFIHLHSQNLIGELREEFMTRYGDHCVPIQNAQRIAQFVKDKKAALKALTPDADPSDEDVVTEVTPSAKAEAKDDEISPMPPTKAGKDDPILSAEELVTLTDTKALNLPEIVISGQRFVRFRDLIPEAPPRGHFNVERVRGSQYFFS